MAMIQCANTIAPQLDEANQFPIVFCNKVIVKGNKIVFEGKQLLPPNVPSIVELRKRIPTSCSINKLVQIETKTKKFIFVGIDIGSGGYIPYAALYQRQKNHLIRVAFFDRTAPTVGFDLKKIGDQWKVIEYQFKGLSGNKSVTEKTRLTITKEGHLSGVSRE